MKINKCDINIGAKFEKKNLHRRVEGDTLQ